MKKFILLFVVAIVLVLVFAPVALSALELQEAQKITVRSKEINSGVVILTVQEGKNSFELQCNKNFAGCAVLETVDGPTSEKPWDVRLRERGSLSQESERGGRREAWTILSCVE